MAQLFANAARSTLTASITAGSTQLQINPADQALFPVATGADWFKVALEDSSGNLEFMRVQRAVGQSLLTITERATEDATKFPARAFVAGSLVELRMTAADLASSIAHPSVGTGAHAATAISVTPVGGISASTVQAALQEIDAEKANAADVTAALAGKASTGANSFAGAQTLPGNAINALEAVPKQQAESIAAAAVANRMQHSLTASQPTTSGTAVDFTGIPSWAKRVTLIAQDVSTNGASQLLVQIGTSAGISATGYVGANLYYLGGSSGAAETLSSGFRIFIGGATIFRFGTLVLTRLADNKWVASGQVAHAGGFAWVCGVRILPGVLDRLRLTTVNGTDSFTQGEVSLLIEG